MRALTVSFVAWAVALAVALAQPRTLFPGTIDQHPAIDYRGSAVTAPVSQLQRGWR